MVKRLITIFIIIGLLITGTPSFAVNDDVTELEERIRDKEEKIESLKKAADSYASKMENALSQSKTVEGQIGYLDNQITKTELDISATQLTIDKTKLEIEDFGDKIEIENAKVEKLKQKLVDYIQTINKYDQKTLLEIIILNENFSEFFSQVNYTEEIQKQLQDSLSQIKLFKETLAVKKAELETRQEELAKLKEDLQYKQTRLNDELKAKELILTQSQSSEFTYAKLLLEVKEQENQFDSDILNIKDEILARLAELEGGERLPVTTLSWPVPSEYVTAYFHDPDYPFRYLFEHNAIDIRASQRTQVKAAASGYVAKARDGGYGYSYITLIHDGGISTVYGHVNEILVRQGQYVSRGETIGLSGGMPGTAGAGSFVTGPHLHFEVRLNGIPVNPLDYL